MRNLSKILALFLLIFIFSTLACNKDDSPTQSKKVAMLAQGTTFEDRAFLQSCKTGLELAKADFMLKCEYNLDTATNNYQERIAYFGDQNFDLIILIGYMWNDATAIAAEKYPNSKFVLVDTELSNPQPNAVSILFDVDEAAFPLGFLSAWWADSHDSESAAAGYVGALEIPQIRQFTEPFLSGVNRYNQNYGKSINIMGDYAGDFFNADLGMHIADSLIGLGVDIIFGVGSETGNGALLQAKQAGKWGIGVDVDQYISYPEVSNILISSAIKGLDNAIYAVVSTFVNNTFVGGGIYRGNLSNTGVGLAPYHDYDELIPDSIKIEVDKIKAGIIDGSISTGW